MRTFLVVASTALAFGLAGCVGQGKYDAALNDATSAHKDLDACKAKTQQADDLAAENQKLRDQLAAAPQQPTPAASSTADTTDAAELEELRKAKADADARAKLLDNFVTKLKKMIDAGKLKVVVRHGRLVLQLTSDVLFDPGKTEIKKDGKTALQEIAGVLRTVPTRRFQVTGHTDAVPIKTKEFPSNWELSTARAVEVLKLLVSFGVNPAAMSAAGYGPFDPVSGNAALNRRIEITLQPDMGELAKLPASAQ
jgi:chemotaxis protein MotB